MRKIMKKKATPVAVLTLLFSAAFPLWGGPPPNPPASDNFGNTAGGTSALPNVARHNTGLGHVSNNPPCGDMRLKFNMKANATSAVGALALFNDTADNNTAVGAGALRNNGTGSNNTASGFQALNL